MLIKSVPKSDATNVDELLQDVKQAILEEPRRLNMNYVALKVVKGSYHYPNSRNSFKLLPLPVPSCGTVGCFAGWTQMLAGIPVAEASRNWIEGAIKILGSDLMYHFTGHDGSTYEYFNWGAGDGIQGMKPGTRAYARAVIKRINRFIEANGGRKALKARTIKRAD